MKSNITFYTIKVNGVAHTTYTTIAETLEDLIKWMADGKNKSIEIIRSDGIWELVSQVGADEDYSDEWMKDVLSVANNLLDAIEKEQRLLT